MHSKPVLTIIVLLALFLLGGKAHCETVKPVDVSTSIAAVDEIVKLWENSQRGEAHKRVDHWMKEEKPSPFPWVAAARLKFLEGKYKAALSLAQDAINKSPSCAQAYYWRGRAYEAMKKPLDAGNEYRAAMIADKGYLEAQDGLKRVEALLESADGKN